jgi:predicted  nucleic acid-binding Zn-ribbon protein
MPHDLELDRLKIVQDQRFQEMQSARRDQDRAWERRKSAQETLNRIYERKEAAYQRQQQAWEDLQRVRDRNGPRIDSLNSQQERAFQNMREAFDRASAAYEARDGTSARSYADAGHHYKAEAQACVSERRQLVQEIRDAGDRHKSTEPEFQAAKREFESARSEHQRAKNEHEREQHQYRDARQGFEHAKQAFHLRLERVRNERKATQQNRRSLAEQAGVPARYIDDVWVSVKPDGAVHIYFGGQGAPNGPGHGHYVMDTNGHVTYARDPYGAHGSHNFTDSQGDYDAIIGSVVAEGGEFGFNCEFRGYHAYVESNVNKQGQEKIDIYYGPLGPFGPGHHHAVALRRDPYNFVYDGLR